MIWGHPSMLIFSAFWLGYGTAAHLWPTWLGVTMSVIGIALYAEKRLR